MNRPPLTVPATDDRYRGLVESVQAIVWRIDPDTGCCTYVSPDAEKVLGYPADQWLRPNFWQEHVHRDDLARVQEFMGAVLAGTAKGDVDLRVLAADGRWVWVRCVMRALPLENGRQELVGVSFDQTARHRADAQLVGDLRILELIAAGTPLPAVLDELVRIMEEQSDGMTGSVLLLDGRHVRHGAAPNLPAPYVRAVDGQEIGPDRGSCGTAAHFGETVIVEDIETDPRWALYRDVARSAGLRACWSVPILGKDRKVLGTFALYYSKPRKPVAEQLELAQRATHLAAIAIESHRREEALRATSEHLDLIYRHVDDVLFHLRVEPDGNYRFLSVNPAFCKSTGMEASTIIGRTVRDVIPEPSLSVVLDKYREAIRTKSTVRWEETTPYPTGARSGDVAITPVFDAAGAPAFLVGSVRDFTERKRLEEDVRQLQKLDAVGQLTGGVAHDFNNLLTVILGYGELLLGRYRDDPASMADLQEMLNAGRRASALTRQLLAFARKQNLQPQKLDLNAVVSGLERMLRRLIREDIAFSLNLAPGLWEVMADPGQIEQVLVNLAVNARDAMPGGGRLSFETANLDAEAAAKVSGLSATPTVMLSISDTGTGMDAATQKRLFEPFFTTKEKGKGTGLGLATVYGIIKQSGGHIAVSSAVGKGTTFRVYLPRGTRPTEAMAAVRPPSGVHRVGGERILLVEDEPALRALGERMLKSLRYQVMTAVNGEEALKALLLEKTPPDLLITDMVMPGMGGEELAARLRKRWPSVRIVFMSGYTEKTQDETIVETAGAVFLQKPFTVASLASTVKKALEA